MLQAKYFILLKKKKESLTNIQHQAKRELVISWGYWFVMSKELNNHLS